MTLFLVSPAYAQTDIVIQGDQYPKLNHQIQYKIIFSGNVVNKGIVEIAQYSEDQEPSWMKQSLNSNLETIYTTKFDQTGSHTIHVKNGNNEKLLDIFPGQVPPSLNTLNEDELKLEFNEDFEIMPEPNNEQSSNLDNSEKDDSFPWIGLLGLLAIPVYFVFQVLFRKNPDPKPDPDPKPKPDPKPDPDPKPEPEPELPPLVPLELFVSAKTNSLLTPQIKCIISETYSKCKIELFSSTDEQNWKKIHESNELQKDPWYFTGEEQNSQIFFDDYPCNYDEKRFYKAIAVNSSGSSTPVFTSFTAPGMPKPPESINDFTIDIDNSHNNFGNVVLKWHAPNDNGSKITNYEVISKDKINQNLKNTSCLDTVCSIDLEKGHVYEFEIFATNAGGTSNPGIKKEKFITSKSLDEYQQKVVSFSFDFPILVNAGPGSGKTTVIVERVKDLILNQKISPEKILCVTFNKRAQENMVTRLQNDPDLKEQNIVFPKIKKFPSGYERSENIRTWNSLGREIAEFKSSNHFESIETKKWIKDNCSKFGFNNSKDQLRDLDQAISSFKTELISPEILEDYLAKLESKDEILENFCKLYSKYIQNLYSLKKFDHADELVSSYTALKDSPIDKIRWSKKFDHVLVDEFQDNNFVQTEIARFLAPDGKITVVGDADQTINTFQGSNVENFTQFKNHYGLNSEQEIGLLYNYRSTKNIVNCANHAISIVSNRQEKTIKTKNESGSKISHYTLDDQSEQAELITQIIHKRIGKKLTRRDGKTSPINFGDFAIVTRMTNHRDQLSSQLKELGIPVTNNMENPQNSVAIGTVHASKGLEFPFVFVAYFFDAIFPLGFKSSIVEIPESLRHYPSDQSEKGKHDDEETRIFYVAITRAIDSLYLLYPKKGNFGSTSVSPFFINLEEKCKEIIDFHTYSSL